MNSLSWSFFAKSERSSDCSKQPVSVTKRCQQAARSWVGRRVLTRVPLWGGFSANDRFLSNFTHLRTLAWRWICEGSDVREQDGWEKGIRSKRWYGVCKRHGVSAVSVIIWAKPWCIFKHNNCCIDGAQPIWGIYGYHRSTEKSYSSGIISFLQQSFQTIQSKK